MDGHSTMLFINFIITSSYNESQNKSLLATRHPKIRRESDGGELVTVELDLMDCMVGAIEEELAKYIWIASSMILIPVRAAANDYENDNRGEGINDKNYSIEVTQGPAEYYLIPSFQVRFIRRSVLFSSKYVTYREASELLINNSFMTQSLKNSLYAKFSCICATLVGAIREIVSNLSKIGLGFHENIWR
jgi:hypothetical protein